MSKASQAKRTAPKPSPDGMVWSPVKEDELNTLAADTFAVGSGKLFLDYLKQLTGGAFGPDTPDGVLRHAAGQRWLVSVIDARTARGIAKRKAGK
jgi:hypothetical protein